MKKTLVSLTESQMESLNAEAKRLEISKSELLRRIMHMYLNGDNKIVMKDPIFEKRKKKYYKKKKLEIE